MNIRKINLTLTSSKTPKDLLNWMNKNLTYEGKYKGYLRTPEQVVKDKKGHCWETAELTNKELTKLGFSCQTLYLTNDILYNEDTVTHSTIIYKNRENEYYWFEWAWLKYEGIHGPYKDLDCVLKFVINIFNKTYKNIAIAKLSNIGLINLTNETDYINLIDTWTDVLKKKYISIEHHSILFNW